MMYLENSQLTTYLRLGKSVEQWLGTTKYKDETIIRWLAIHPGRSGACKVNYIESLDEGSEEFLDIYEFGTFDPDLPFGKTDSFENIEDALAFCHRQYNADKTRFVNVGMIQEEYRLYLVSKTEV